MKTLRTAEMEATMYSPDAMRRELNATQYALLRMMKLAACSGSPRDSCHLTRHPEFARAALWLSRRSYWNGPMMDAISADWGAEREKVKVKLAEAARISDLLDAGMKVRTDVAAATLIREILARMPELTFDQISALAAHEKMHTAFTALRNVAEVPIECAVTTAMENNNE